MPMSAPPLSVAAALRAFGSDSADPTALADVLETRRQQLRRAQQAKSKKKKSNPDIGAIADEEPEGTVAVASVDEQLRALPRSALVSFCAAAAEFLEDRLGSPSSDALSDRDLLTVETLAQFATVLVEDHEHVAAEPASVLPLAQMLHDHLLRLKGDPELVPSVQEAIALLCEACWRTNYHDAASTVVTQLLPYLIVRAYESQPGDHYASKRHPIRRLFAVKDALLLLDFDDESSGLLRDILLRCYIQPNFFRSPDAVPFLGFLFGLHLPFIHDINATIRNQIPNQRKSILKKLGAIYFKAWVGCSPEARALIEEECIQRYVRDAVHSSSIALFTAVRTVLQIFFENKRHAGVDEMLYRVTSPILWRGVKAANDSVRRQATILLFDNFPLRDPQFNNEMMDRTLQKQFDAFEELLGDSHPAVRIAAIQGVSKVLSVYWELLPAETIRCFISKLVVDLVNDVSSSAVRAAVFEGVQFILDNHHSHSILKPLLPMLAPLINDRNERVRAEFVSLLVRIKSIRNLHFYDVVSVNDLLDRLVVDRDSPVVRKQLVLLFLNSYFPQSVGGSSQVARCLALVKKHPEAAMVFYGHVADHASVGSVCKLAALLCRCSLNFVSKRLKKPQDEDEDEDDEDDEDGGFSVVGRIVVLEIMANLLKSVHVKVLNDERFTECKSFLAEQLNVDAMVSLLAAYSDDRPFDQEALCAIWKTIGFLGELSEGALLEPLVGNLMSMDESSSKKLLDAMVECLTKWHQLPFLVSKVEEVLTAWTADRYAIKKVSSTSKKSSPYRLHPVVALTTAEYIVQSTASPCPKHLMDRLVKVLKESTAPLMAYSTADILAICQENAFGIFRLVEVHAKLLVLAEAANVCQQATSLLESSNVKPALGNREALRAMQPSAFFTPPTDLVDLLGWVSGLVAEMTRNGVHEPAKTAGKKRRKGASKEGSSEPVTQASLLNRWRNLFSLVAMLANECVAISLKRETDHTVAEDFVNLVVGRFCDVIDTFKDLGLDRAVIMHTCQFLSLLEKERTRSSHPRPSLALWIARIGDALTAFVRCHEDDSNNAKDLFAPVRPLLALDDGHDDPRDTAE